MMILCQEEFWVWHQITPENRSDYGIIYLVP